MSRLTRPERLILLGLIRDCRPRLSCGQVVKLFRARTGKAISRSRILQIERRGYDPTGLDARGRKLSAEQVDLLDVLIRDAKPHYCRSEIARQFEAATGRPLGRQSVYRRCLRLGLPAHRNGRHAGGLVGGEHKTPRVEIDRPEPTGRRMAHQRRGRTSPDRPAFEKE